MPESKVDEVLEQIEDMVPHAHFSDLMFYGERDRSFEELADEAVHRESLWQTGGELAVLVHKHAQMTQALADPATENPYREFAARELLEVETEIRRLKGDRVQ